MNRSTWLHSAVPRVLLGVGLFGAMAAQSTPSGNLKRPKPDQDLRSQRQAFFMRGRRSLDAMPAAEHQRLAWAHARRMPYVGSGWNRHISSMKRPYGPSPTGGSWTELGPSPEYDYFFNNVSGRVTALAVDLNDDASGNTVYLGAAYGGIWVSTNAQSASATWKPLTDGQATLSVGAIALTSAGSTVAGKPTIVAGTGEPDNAGDSYYGMGLLVSHDGGATWKLVSSADGGLEKFMGAGFSRILVDPQNPQILLAAVATTAVAYNTPYVRGIYRSTDGGDTWSLVEEVLDTSGNNYSCTDLVYDATTKAYLAAFRGAGFYKSTNQGASWTALTASPFAKVPPGINSSTYDNFYRVSMAARSGAIFAVIADSNGALSAPNACAAGQTSGCDTGLVESINDGGSWTPITAPTCTSTTAQNCTSGETLFDAGAGPQGDYDQPIFAPPGSNALVVGGIDLWQATTVNGMTTTWTDLTNAYGNGSVHADQHALAAVNANTWYIGCDGGIWGTSDAGTNWTDLNTGLGTIQFYSVVGDPVTAGVYFGGSQDNDAAISGDGFNPPQAPSSPLQWTADFFGDGGFSATTLASVNGVMTDQYFSENNGVSLTRSDQGGQINISTGADSFYNNAGNPNVVVDNNFITDAADFYVPYQILPNENTQIILGTCRVWEGPSMPSSDGQGWVAISPDLTSGGSGTGTCANNGYYITALAQAPSDSATLYAVTDDGQVAYTTNATCISSANCATGTLPTWQVASPLPLVATKYQRPLSSIAISPTDSKTIFVGVMDFGVNEGTGSGGQHIFMSTNAGTAWTDITGNLPDSPLNWILIDPNAPKNIYVATDVGVFVTQDGGAGGATEQWQQLGSGLPAAAILQLNFTQAGANYVIAATHGRGAWIIPALNTPAAFTLTATPASATVNAGQTASYVLSITPTGGFTGTVNLSCSGAPSKATCSVSPASVSINNASAVQATVSVATTAPTALPIAPPRAPRLPWPLAAQWGLWLAGALSLLLASRRRRMAAAGGWLRRLGWTGIALVALGMAGCSSSSSSGSNSVPGTPSGSYTLTVTATSGSVSQSQALTLNVN